MVVDSCVSKSFKKYLTNRRWLSSQVTPIVPSGGNDTYCPGGEGWEKIVSYISLAMASSFLSPADT
jgi:hypothetical protein